MYVPMKSLTVDELRWCRAKLMLEQRKIMRRVVRLNNLIANKIHEQEKKKRNCTL